MKILLTGSNGFVGKNIIENPQSKNYKFLTPNSDQLNLLNINSINKYLKKNKPNMIIHTAGYVGGIDKNQKNNTEFFYKNYIIGFNLIFSAYDNNIKKILNLSSSCFYSPEAKKPLEISSVGKGTLEKTNFGYALAKLSVHNLCSYFNSIDKNTQYKTLIPTNLFGKFDTYHKDNSHLISAIIVKLDQLQKSNKIETIDMWGTGKPLREFMFATDFANIIFYILKNFSKTPTVINIGSGYNKSILFYYKKISEILQKKIKIKKNLNKPDGVKDKLLNLDALKKLGWTKYTPFEKAIQITYKHYLNHKTVNWKLSENTWNFDEEMILNTFSRSKKYAQGNYVKEFEKIFAKKYTKKYAVMLNSFTSANLLMVEALKYHSKFQLKKGDEIILSALSCSKTHLLFSEAGYKIKLVDIDIDTLNIDINILSEAITKKTKAILLLNTLGNSNNFDQVKKIIKNKNIILLEDNCESLNGKFKNKFTGSFGLMSSSSFCFSHHLSSIEGGMILTNDDELNYIIKILRDPKSTENIKNDHTLLNKNNSHESKINFYKYYNSNLNKYNLKPQELSAAIAISQFSKLNNFINHRRSNANFFLSKIKSIPYIKSQKEIGKSSWFAFTITIVKFKNKLLSRDKLSYFLNIHNIETKPVIMKDLTITKASKYLDIKIHNKLFNAEYIDKNSLYISNHSIDIRVKIEKLIELLNIFLKDNF